MSFLFMSFLTTPLRETITLFLQMKKREPLPEFTQLCCFMAYKTKRGRGPSRPLRLRLPGGELCLPLIPHTFWGCRKRLGDALPLFPCRSFKPTTAASSGDDPQEKEKKKREKKKKKQEVTWTIRHALIMLWFEWALWYKTYQYFHVKNILWVSLSNLIWMD